MATRRKVDVECVVDARNTTGESPVWCDREQAFLLRAIRDDVDLTDHMRDAVNSLRIVLAADESVRSGEIVRL